MKFYNIKKNTGVYTTFFIYYFIYYNKYDVFNKIK